VLEACIGYAREVGSGLTYEMMPSTGIYESLGVEKEWE
jgi:hypothetical protein